MKWFRVGSAALLLFTFTACESLEDIGDLEVTNQNDPERERAIATAGDIEKLIQDSYEKYWQGTHAGSPSMSLSSTADEFSISWGNYGQQQMSSEPRVQWPNASSFRYASATRDAWYDMYEALSSVHDGLIGLKDADVAASLGASGVARVTAFGRLVQGLAHGWLALAYDSAFVFDETIELDPVELTILEIKGYTAIWAAALGYFNEAIALGNAGDWSIPSSWINGNALSSSEFVQYVHTEVAKHLPLVARTPAERALVDWNAVISHIDAGLTEDFAVDGDGDVNWWSAMHYFGQLSASTTWARADYKTIGQYDTGGGYAAWLSLVPRDRKEFTLSTPDRRIHAAGDGTAAGTDFKYTSASAFPSSRGTYHHSRYLGTRYDVWPATEIGPMPHLLTEYFQLNKAEALMRLSGVVTQQVVDIVNDTRVTRGGMTALTTGDTFDDVMDALVYERRIENYGVCVGCAFFNRRGEGPLVDSRGSPVGTHHQGPVEGTARHFAPPGKELESLAAFVYSYGGVGNEGPTSGPAAAPSAGFSGTTVPANLIYIAPGEDRDDGGRAIRRASASLVHY